MSSVDGDRAVACALLGSDPGPSLIYTLSLHDALPICAVAVSGQNATQFSDVRELASPTVTALDRKSTRLNSSHLVISYAVFCLKKKRKPGTRAGRGPHPSGRGRTRDARRYRASG